VVTHIECLNDLHTVLIKKELLDAYQVFYVTLGDRLSHPRRMEVRTRLAQRVRGFLRSNALHSCIGGGDLFGRSQIHSKSARNSSQRIVSS
jgi:hypothetical protein